MKPDFRPSRFGRASPRGRLVLGAFICGLGALVYIPRPCQAFPVAKLRGVRPIAELKSGKRSWIVARNRASLVFGDRVRTGPKGAAQIIFGGDTSITLRANTEIEIKEPETASQPLAIRLIGALGEIFIRSKGRTEVRTAAGIAATRGTEYSVRLDSESQTTLTVSEGRVAFSNPQGAVEVSADEQSTARVGIAPTPPIRVDASGLLSWTGDVAGLPLPFELPPSNRDSQALREAKALLEAGDARGAEAAFRAQLASPQADEALAGVALALLSNRDRAGATTALEGTTTPLASGVRALLLLEGGDAPGAQTLLAPLVTAPGAPFQIYTLLALAQIQNADAPGAIRSATRATQLSPSSAAALATLSLAQFFARANDNAALRNARRAVELDPFSPLALLAVGRTEATRGNLDEARQALEQAVLLAPELPGAQRDLGALELALDRLPRAERALRASLAASPDDARTLAALGTVQLRRGDRTGARANLDRAVELAPTDPYVRANRAAFLVENGDLEAAAREGDFLLTRQTAQPATVPNNVPLYTDDPALGALFIRLSESSLFRQQLNEALQYAREAVRLLPNSAPAQYQLGRVFLEQGRTTQAQNRFQLATILNPNDPRARYALGFTQELVAQGGDVSRPLGQIQAAREGAPNVALSLQNQATPGAFERYQAAIQDPTSVRAASRSFGDWQLDGRLGTLSSATGEVSYVHESSDRRGLTAFGLRRDTTAGVRPSADYQESRAAITLGQKAKNSPSALFAFASFEWIDPVRDREFDQPPPNYSNQRQKPVIILGANIAEGQNNRTRLLMQVDRSSSDQLTNTGPLNSDYESIHAEVRHDRQLSDKWSLNAGLSTGQRRYDATAVFNSPSFQLFTNSNVVAHNTVAYTRLAFTPSSNLKLEGELKLRSFNNHVLTGSRFNPPNPFLPPSANESRETSAELLPTVVATYRSGPSTLLRFRARRSLGAIEDFELLSPTDLFGFYSGRDVPELGVGENPTNDPTVPSVNGRGNFYDLELSHSFANSSFLRLGLFRAEQHISNRPDTGEFFNYARVQGLRLGYEGLLNRNTAFFTSASWNGSRAVTRSDFYGGFYSPSTLSGLPDYSAEVGLQYLKDDGLFIQPSLGYIGPRYRARFDGNSARQQFGGFSLFNLRVGKRFGLRRSFYVEVSNLFDHTYTLAAVVSQRLQPGRQVRVGATLRF